MTVYKWPDSLNATSEMLVNDVAVGHEVDVIASKVDVILS